MHPVKSGNGPVNIFPSSHLHPWIKLFHYHKIIDGPNMRNQQIHFIKIRKQDKTYSSTRPVNLVISKGMLPVKFLPDNKLPPSRTQSKYNKFTSTSLLKHAMEHSFSEANCLFFSIFLFGGKRMNPHIKKIKTSKKINPYIETILGWGSELQRTHDHGTGRHGSPPSCAQSAEG